MHVLTNNFFNRLNLLNSFSYTQDIDKFERFVKVVGDGGMLWREKIERGLTIMLVPQSHRVDELFGMLMFPLNAMMKKNIQIMKLVSGLARYQLPVKVDLKEREFKIPRALTKLFMETGTDRTKANVAAVVDRVMQGTGAVQLD